MDMNYLHDQEELKQSTQKVDEERRAFLTAGLVGGAIAAGTLAAGAAHAQQHSGRRTCAHRQAVVAPSQMGQGRPGRRLQLDHAGQGSRRPSRSSRTARSTALAASMKRRCPSSAQRTFNIRITPVDGAFGTNRLVGHDEFLAAEIGQTGTQFDGLGHIGIQMGKPGDLTETRFYNGSPSSR